MSLPEPTGSTGDPRTDLEAFEAKVTARLQTWGREGYGPRFWRHDPTLWPAAPPEVVRSRMGWTELPMTMKERVEGIVENADEVREDGFERVVLLGMGGSSLAAEVIARTFGPAKGHPSLHVLDSTHPDAVRRAAADIPLEKIFFIVSSKSGTTLEPNSYFAYFWKEVTAVSADPGQQFCAITDSGTPLEALAEEKGFRQSFTPNPDVGGRYSALTEFGLVPAALLGVPVGRLLEHAGRMAKACGADVDVAENPALRLGAELGELAVAGRDKVVFLASPSLTAFPSWAEQLIAESTGKLGRGIIPIADEVDRFDSFRATDRVLAYLTVRGEEDEKIDGALAQAEAEGTPAVVCELSDRLDLGGEFLRWEIAVASASSVLGIDPFDQPDVELAKELAREAMANPIGSKATAPERALAENASALGATLVPWLASARADDYLAIQAFVAPSPEVDRALRGLRTVLRERLKVSTTLGYGPRFLHSTGQLHKGGPNSGLFLQLVQGVTEDVMVPPGPTTFGGILRAQADGDAGALLKTGRRLAKVDVGKDADLGILAVTKFVQG
ncbi:MAG: hypothetical protein L3J95_03600 [Thermoplasmata archaeon]|nr:hypothetical protein [Thermoplasmata archaeon]MCI4359492.1 hypothetical protein [Thermoplasmata archaeon]